MLERETPSSSRREVVPFVVLATKLSRRDKERRISGEKELAEHAVVFDLSRARQRKASEAVVEPPKRDPEPPDAA